jgi:glycine oxidase
MHATSCPTSVDTVVIGGGVIGLVTAWLRARDGVSTLVVDAERPHAASGVAAGMLTPASEATFGEETLMRLAVESRDSYGAFVADLERDSGREVGYRTTGTLQVGFDPDDLATLDHLRDLQDSLGVKAERLTSRQCRRLEPMLAPGVRGGILAADDHSVHTRLLAEALAEAGRRHGMTVRRELCTEVAVEGGAARGVVLASGERIAAEQVVLAAGAWASDIAGLPDGVLPPVRPVKGQLLRLRHSPGEGPLVARTVRGLVRGRPIYLVPRDGGEVVVGATQEDVGYDTRLTAGGVGDVLRHAQDLVPGVSEAEVVEAAVGLRPATPDNAPALGPTAVEGLHLAVGHHRHGVLLTPLTGHAMAQALRGDGLPDHAAPFAATRFA